MLKWDDKYGTQITNDSSYDVTNGELSITSLHDRGVLDIMHDEPSHKAQDQVVWSTHLSLIKEGSGVYCPCNACIC